MKRLVLGVDPATDTTPLIEWTARLATELAASVTAVHVLSRAVLWTISGFQGDFNAYIRNVRDRLDHGEMARLWELGVAADLEVRRGDPAHELVETARRVDADMIIIGGTHHHALHDAVVGDVRYRVERHSPVPVVVVPSGVKTVAWPTR
jgi:nucleotide-binding universal stress UspA family protein